MKTLYTPESVLVMLQSVKKLADEQRFTSMSFRHVYPSFYSFRKTLYSKGLLKKIDNRECWVSIEPNIIMATEILKIYKQKYREAEENRRLQNNPKLLQDLEDKYAPKEISNEVEAIEEVEPIKEIQDLHDALYKINREKEAFRHENINYKNVNIAEQVQNKNYKQQLEKITEDRDLLYSNVELHIKENKVLLEKNSRKNSELLHLKKIHSQLIEESEERQAYLIEKLKERQEVIDELIGRDNVKKESEKQEEVILPNSELFYKDLTSQEIMSSKPLTSKSTRTFKVLGIPIFTIDNK
jgi:hypothetical protein